MRDLIYLEAQNIGWATEMALQARMIDTYQTSFYQTHYTIQKGTGLAYDFNKLSNHLDIPTEDQQLLIAQSNNTVIEEF